jgi:riboflavin synthase
MFTGIIEAAGRIVATREEGSNRRLTIQAPLAPALKVDQSLAHNGACLTVEAVHPAQNQYEVVAIAETLQRTSLGGLREGHVVNLERSLRADARLDGHFVQGHVDGLGYVDRIESQDGSWLFRFRYPDDYAHLLVEKGAICVNGVSLTLVEAGAEHFSVAIIPYTYEHTNFHELAEGEAVNLEFDVLGKYVHRLVRQGWLQGYWDASAASG